MRVGVDLIVTSGTQVNRAAQQGTTTIPIVTMAEADPVGNGFAVSLARPGRNITGFSTLFTETIAKNFEYLVLTVPKLSRIAVLRNLSNPASEAQLASIQAAALKAADGADRIGQRPHRFRRQRDYRGRGRRCRTLAEGLGGRIVAKPDRALGRGR